MGSADLVDPVTGVPLEDLMLSAAKIGGVDVDDPVDGADPFALDAPFDPDTVPSSDPVIRRGPPVIAGFHKIDFNDDDAVEEMVAGIVEQYEAAAKAAGLKMAPKGTLKVVSIGGVPVEDDE